MVNDNGSIKIRMTPSHPGDFVRTEVIEELGLSVKRAAEILGVRRATLSDLLNANASLSPEMALRIEKAFDVNMDMLLRMQAWHDASRMRARESEVSVQRYQPAQNPPERHITHGRRRDVERIHPTLRHAPAAQCISAHRPSGHCSLYEIQ